MKRRLIGVCLFASILPLLAAPATRARPNILFILADDYGLDGVGCYGSDRFKGKTPNIDALAATGIRFERAYCTPLCGPTRCELMTGRYGFRSGGLTNPTGHMPSSKEEPSLARTLRQAGYVTGMAGKWRQMGETPGDWGFDEYITDPTAGGWYWVKSYTRNGQRVDTEREIYYPDLTMDFTRDFIRRHRDEAFFFYFPSHLVHGPILRTPDTRDGKDLYEDNVAYLDKQVGLLVAEIEKVGLREKTLIVFGGDNGTARQSGTIRGRQINGHKGTMLEGGAHVPLIASWKGTAPEGRVLADLVDFSDLFPTFMEVAGGRMPEGVRFDGRSFAPQLRGEKGNPRDWIFVQLGRNWYARNDGWKLTQSGGLFDQKDAPFVEKPVAPEAEDAAAKAGRKALQAVLDELKPASGKVPGLEDAMKKKARQQKRKAKQARKA
jgi:arylsulfatase A-like enzyme